MSFRSTVAKTRRRVMVGLAERLGFTVTRVGPGVAIVSRRSGPNARVEASALGTRGWLVERSSASANADLKLVTQAMKHLTARHVAWQLRKYRVDCVLDVGANTGQYARELREHGYEGYIVSFEPVPQYVEKLKAATANDDKWAVWSCALGSAEGVAPINVQRTFSSLLPSSEYGRERFDKLREHSDEDQVNVPVRRLDAIFDELLAPVVASGVEHPRVYLKMDTQGFDLQAFAGLGDRAGDVVGLQSEVALLPIYERMPRMPEALATYEAAGFEISGMYPVSRERDGRVIEYDCLMVRADSL